MIRERLILLAMAIAMPAFAIAAGEETLVASLARCAAIDDDPARLACFDELARDADRVPVAQAPATASEKTEPDAVAGSAAPAAGTAIRPLTDDVGRGQVGDRSNEDARDEVYTARLAGCEQAGPSERMYFLLDNGQAWRQSDSDRLRLEGCGGEVRISRDFFGYKLYIEDEDVTIRVRRVR